MIGINTNILLRLWLNDDPAQNKRIDALLAAYGGMLGSLLVTDVVLAEAVWTLKSAFEQDKHAQSLAVRSLLEPVVITEAGWCTNSNGRGMNAEHAVQELQAIYLRDLMAWTDAAGVLTFVFEAFDEPWKGSPDPMEPEKHWGLFTVDRQPKLAMTDWR